MSRALSVLILTFCALALFHLPAKAQPEIIPAGTILQCTLDEPNFSSKTAMVGDPLLCHLGPVSTFGHSAFPRGAMLGGHLEEYKNPGHFFGKGWLALQFDRLIIPGEVVPISAKIISAPHLKVDKKGDIHGKGHPTRDAVEWSLPILWPEKVLTLPARGPYPTLKGETRLALRLMEDVELPMPVARYSVPMPPRPTPSAYRYGFGASSNSKPIIAETSPAIEHAAYTLRDPEPAPAPSKVTIIALKDGSAFLVADYWVKGGLMHFISSSGQDHLLPLGRIDLPETVRVNQERQVNFVLQSPDADGIQ
jgi:hypothetical protein